ncbi:hypothetical protein NFI96_015208 [Prochilodus magdalenae]|nr:hypothetical protein NFI96_015208 [Prochilodus magdalenae]
MSSVENTEVYIPKNACVRNIPVQSLPLSIARKMGVRPLPRSAKDMSDTVTWITPVELREKEASSRTAQTHRFLTQGQFKLPVVSSNSAASKILSMFLDTGKNMQQSNEPDTPTVCGRVSSHRQNSIVLYGSQLFLSVRRKRTLSSQSDSSSPVLPDQELPLSSARQGSPEVQSPEMQLGDSNRSQQGAVFLPQSSSETEKQPQEAHKYGAADDSSAQKDPIHEIVDGTKEKLLDASDSQMNGGIRDNKRGDGQSEGEDKINGELLEKETGASSSVECDKEGNAGVEAMENVEESNQQAEGPDDQNIMDNSDLKDVNMSTFDMKTSNVMDSGVHLDSRADGDITVKVSEACVAGECESNGHTLPAEAYRNSSEIFPVISHITSLAEGWNSADEMEKYGTFHHSSEEPKPEEAQHCEPADEEARKLPHTLSAEISAQSRSTEAQAPSLDSSLQDTGEEGSLPCFMLPFETRQLDFEDLERRERLDRIRNEIRKMEAKLKMEMTGDHPPDMLLR